MTEGNMEKLHRLYNAAMALTIAGLVLYGVGKLLTVLAYRAGAMLLISILLTLPVIGLLGVGLVLTVCGVGCFIALTSEQKKEANPAHDA